MATAWATLHTLGREGYLRLTQETVETRARMVDGIRAIEGLTVLGEPEAQCVAMATAPGYEDQLDVFAVGDALLARGWFHDRQKPPDSLHSTVSAGNAPVIEQYLADLAACVREVGGTRLTDRSTSYATLE
jgi:glutamate/tyrosine decarboxylase-like PLP-dependent enzyme